MLRDHELFVQLCEKHDVVPPSEILDAIRESSATGELRLSCLSIMIPVCEIIGQMLASSSTIKVLDLSECMLLSKGLSAILNALCEGSSVTSLYLKGNNVNGTTVAQLGKVFLRNNTLKRLHVEWNSIGADPEFFAPFCDGLVKNHNVEELDLRYNQISPHCADSLCKLIKRNRSLRILDLSWNTLGLQGGESILTAIRDNSYIAELGLRGNCIPNEILQAINDVVHENNRRRAATESSLSRGIEIIRTLKAKDEKGERQRVVNRAAKEDVEQLTSALKAAKVDGDTFSPLEDDDGAARKSKVLRKKKQRRVRVKTGSPDISDSGDSDSPTSGGLRFAEGPPSDGNPSEVTDKIAELNLILQERTAAIDLLSRELAEKVAAADSAKEQVDRLQTEIGRLREEKSRLDLDRVKEITELQRIQKESEETWQKLYKELEATYERCLQGKKEADSKIRRYERDIHKSTVEISLLKDKLVSTSQAYEDLLSKSKTEMHRIRRESKERENRNRIELNVLKNTLKETTQALEDCQNQLQKTRNELREQFETQSLLKARLNEAEHLTLRHVRLEESFQKAKEEKESLEEKLNDSQRLVAALQRQVTSLQGELIEPRRRYDLLKEELSQEKQKTQRLQEELVEDRGRLKEQNLQIEKMSQQIISLNAQLNEIQNSHAEALREKDRERKQLKEVIASKERDFTELRAEEVQRAGHLYAAFSKYLGSIGPSPIL